MTEKEYTVLLTADLKLAGIDKMRQLFKLKVREKDTPPAVWDAWLAEADAICSTGGLPIDEALLAKAPRLKVVSKIAAGYDNIDVPACTRRGIRVGNVPDLATEATADVAYGLILMSARYLHKAYLHVTSGEWGRRRPFSLGIDLKDKLLGVVGLGKIGLATAKRALASGMRVAYYNRRPAGGAAAVDAAYLPLDELLASADFILLALPLNSESGKIIGAAQLARMKPTARLINIGRGGLVDTDALCQALAEKKIAYAALDVTDPEPLPGDHPLLKLDNVFISPHIGAMTRETRDAMSLFALDNILAALNGRKMPACVNGELEK
jgi:glyoxylate reductase